MRRFCPWTFRPESSVTPRPNRSRRSTRIPTLFPRISTRSCASRHRTSSLPAQTARPGTCINCWPMVQVVLVFYHGCSCALCVRQLFDSNNDVPLFNEVGARIVEISSDPPELTRQRFEPYGRSASRSFRTQGTRRAKAYQVFRRAQDGRLRRTSPSWDIYHRSARHGSMGQCWAICRPVAIWAALSAGQDRRPFTVVGA